MPRPFTLLDSVPTHEGALELRRRGDDFLVTIGGRVLMSSHIHRTEDAVATLAIEAMESSVGSPRVLIGGLGLGFTLRAALDALPAGAELVVAEITERVVDWCRGPVAPSIGHALDDPRVRVEVADLIDVVRSARGLDAIVIDLYEGPRELPRGAPDPLYGAAAIRAVWDALAEGGVYAVWSEEPFPPFERRLERQGFSVTRRRVGRGGPRHAVYLAVKREGQPGAEPSRRAQKRR